jgi:AraC-like DNA-binding protein/mannose-6-phosphate isomerase-like protein (cupin superfamily)
MDWDSIWTNEDFLDFSNGEGSPYISDREWGIIKPNDNTLSDDILDYFQTDIYAMIPPNFLPMFMHYHTYFELVYILEGTCRNVSGNQKLILEKGDLLILAPGTSHAISTTDRDCRIVNIMIRTGTFVDSFFHDFYQDDVLYSFFYNVLFGYKTNTYILFHTGEDFMIRNTVIGLLEKLIPYHRYQNKFRVLSLATLFARLMDRHASSTVVYVDDSSSNEMNIALILSYIQQNFRTVTLTSLADFFGYSERHMSRILKSYTGKSYQDTILDVKMSTAAQLLKESSDSIEHISEELGFATPFSFRKCFKKHYQMTPGEYRKKLT